MRLVQVLRTSQKGGGALTKWVYNLAGFNKYGLKRHDVIYENDDVKEAIRRMPLELQDERTFRMRRAIQLSCAKTILPKDQWTKYEEDDLYMKPYLDEVIREREEREAWEKK